VTDAPFGVLVMAYGTASGPDDIERYYTDIRGGRPPTPDHLEELKARYAAIGNIFPLLEITRAQGEGIVERLNGTNEAAFRTYLGMKHSPPFIPDTVARMRADGVERAVGIVMAPQWSGMSVETYIERVEAAAGDSGPAFAFVRSYHDHPAFIAFLARRVADARELLTRPIVAWALYDFGNTIFSYAVVTAYFNDWIIDQRGAPDWYVGAMDFVVAVALVLTLPLGGALADRYGRRKPFLVGFTLVCVTATAALGGVDKTLLAFSLGGVAIFGFQSALVHYDPLLVDIAPERLRGRVSGVGGGIGYAGALVAVGVLGLVVPDDDNQRAFLPTAAMFLLFALPCFLLVRERARARRGPERIFETASAAVGQLRTTYRHAREYRDVGRFLVARFLYADAVQTIIVFMVVYARRVGHVHGAAKTALLALSIVFAVVGALAAGAAVERVGPKRVLVTVLSLLVVTMVVTAGLGGRTILWLTGPIVGVALGTLAASDRIFLLRLAPAPFRGEFFGFAALVSKLSSGLGPLVLWGGVIWLLSDASDLAGKPTASRVAVVVLAGACLAGVLTLRPLSDAPRAWSTE
jgi:UMF1 family MFS transporter